MPLPQVSGEGPKGYFTVTLLHNAAQRLRGWRALHGDSEKKPIRRLFTVAKARGDHGGDQVTTARLYLDRQKLPCDLLDERVGQKHRYRCGRKCVRQCKYERRSDTSGN